MKILIADDEPLARQRLELLIHEIDPEYEIYATASNGVEALKQCLQYTPNIALLDIRMPTMDGLQVAAEIRKAELDTRVIFVTAFDQYAIQAFDQNAIDYLLKPVKKQRLQQSLTKASQTLSQPGFKQLNQASPAPRQHLCAHTHNGLELVAIKDIIYFKADNKYVLAVTHNNSILLDDSLKTLEEEYQSIFFRIHRNALVNINAITGVVKTAPGQLNLQLNNCDETLNVSRRHQAKLNRLLRQKLTPADKNQP